MKKILALIALTLATQAHAEIEVVKYCKTVDSLAVSIVNARNRGITFDQITNVFTDRDMVGDGPTLAYEVYFGKYAKEKNSILVGKNSEIECLKEFAK